MPYYRWRENQTGIEVEVLRRTSEIELPPSPSDEDYPTSVGPEPEWERLLAGGSTWIQAPGYRAGGKGSKGGFVPRINRKSADSL